jgi:hypothetical protein
MLGLFNGARPATQNARLRISLKRINGYMKSKGQSMANISSEIQIYQILKLRIMEAFNLEDDDQALIDTLEGQTPIKDIIVQLIRDAERAEAFAEGIKTIIKDNQARKERLETRVEKLRAMASWAMQETGLKKIEESDMTISQRQEIPPLVITREPDITTPFTKMKEIYSWDKVALRAAVESGNQSATAIAYLGNAKPVLTVRTK